VYFLLSHDRRLVKIGKSWNPRTRITNIRTMNPHELTVLLIVAGYTRVEYWLHRRLRSQRSHGEWFCFHGPVIEVVESLCSGRQTILDLCRREVEGDIADTTKRLSNTK